MWDNHLRDAVTTMTERRKLPRSRIDILFNAFQDGLPALCAGHDVSEGGIGLRTLHDTRRSSLGAVEVEFELPGTEGVIFARGMLRTSGGRAAVVFESLPESSRRLIAEYVAAA